MNRILHIMVFVITASVLFCNCDEVTPVARNSSDDNYSLQDSVFVRTDKQEYNLNEAVVVTITNNLDTTITTIDQRAFCTIIKLETLTGEEWKEVRNCFSLQPAISVTLEGHSDTRVQLPGLSSSGEYRASINFSPGGIFNVGELSIAASSPFTVQ
jgi:hypothetical protein